MNGVIVVSVRSHFLTSLLLAIIALAAILATSKKNEKKNEKELLTATYLERNSMSMIIFPFDADY